MVSVLRADASWLDELSHAHNRSHYRVHSVFERAVNLQNEQGALYTWIGSGLGLAPNTMSLSCAQMNDLGLRVGDRVLASDAGFTWEGTFVGFSQAVGWHLNLPAYQSFDLTETIALIDDFLQKNARDQQMLDKAVYARLASLCEDVQRGVRQSDTHLIKQSLEHMVGLGIGLTPSGDDVLVGLCSAWAMLDHPAAEFFILCQEVIASAQGKTNEISYAALLHAAKGQFNERLVHCLDCIFKRDTKALEEALLAVLAIGSSSGLDMLRGVRMGLLFDKRSEQDAHKNSD